MTEHTHETLKKIRLKHRLTQRDIADASGVSMQNICSIENGTRKLTTKTAKRLLEAMHKAITDRDHRLAQAVTAAFNKPALIELRNAAASDQAKETNHDH